MRFPAALFAAAAISGCAMRPAPEPVPEPPPGCVLPSVPGLPPLPSVSAGDDVARNALDRLRASDAVYMEAVHLTWFAAGQMLGKTSDNGERPSMSHCALHLFSQPPVQIPRGVQPGFRI